MEAFAARAERAGGVWPTLLGTGGLWSPFQVPGSLTTWFGHVLTVAVVVTLVAGGPRVARREPALAAAAVAGILLAGLAHLPGGSETLTWAVGHVPGAGLLRDGQKWLLPYVVALVAAVGVATARADQALRRRDADLGWLLVAVVALPVLLVPDAAGRTWAALEPVRYPADLAAAVAALDDAGGASTTGDAVTLPWSSYRRFSWGNPLSAADPLPRWTHHRTVVSDTLALPGGVVPGEDPRAAEVGAVVTDPHRPLARPLAGLGVGWVLVYRDQPGAADLDTTGLTVVVDGPTVALYRVPDVTLSSSGPSTTAVAVVAVADVLWGAVWLGGPGGGGRAPPTAPGRHVSTRGRGPRMLLGCGLLVPEGDPSHVPVGRHGDRAAHRRGVGVPGHIRSRAVPDGRPRPEPRRAGGPGLRRVARRLQRFLERRRRPPPR